MITRLVLAAVLLASFACEGASARRERVLAAAAAAQAQGDYDRAAAVLQEAISRDPRDSVIVAQSAQLELERNRPAAAQRVLEVLPADVPEAPEIRRLRAHILLRLGDCHNGLRLALAAHAVEREDDEELANEALEAVRARFASCEDMLATLPKEWLTRLVESLLDDGSADMALQAWRRLPAGERGQNGLTERVVAGLLRQPPEDVVATYAELVGPPLSPAKLMLAHRSAVAGGRWSDAAAAEASFARLFPGVTPSFEMLLSAARRELHANQVRRALADSERALELRPAATDALVVRGLALDALGRSAEARAVFAAVLAEDPNNALAKQMVSRTGGEDSRP